MPAGTQIEWVVPWIIGINEHFMCLYCVYIFFNISPTFPLCLQVTTITYVGLLVLEKFPITLIIGGLMSNGLYFLLLKDFPFIELTSPVFLGGVGKNPWHCLLSVQFLSCYHNLQTLASSKYTLFNIHVSVIDQTWGQDCGTVLMDQDEVEDHKHAKRPNKLSRPNKLGQNKICYGAQWTIPSKWARKSHLACSDMSTTPVGNCLFSEKYWAKLTFINLCKSTKFQKRLCILQISGQCRPMNNTLIYGAKHLKGDRMPMFIM